MKEETCVMFLRGIDKKLKNEFRQICLKNEMTMTDAIKAFMLQTMMAKKLQKNIVKGKK